MYIVHVKLQNYLLQNCIVKLHVKVQRKCNKSIYKSTKFYLNYLNFTNF